MDHRDRTGLPQTIRCGSLFAFGSRDTRPLSTEGRYGKDYKYEKL